MVTDREYKPVPVPSWSDIIAAKDEEIKLLKEKIKQLESALYTSERQAHVEMGR